MRNEARAKAIELAKRINNEKMIERARKNIERNKNKN